MALAVIRIYFPISYLFNFFQVKVSNLFKRAMKKNLFFAVASLGGVALMTAPEIKAQDAAVVIEETAIAVDQVKCKDVYSNGSWRDGWYVELGAGVRTPFVEYHESDPHFTTVYNLSVGRWISPYLGFRFSGYYGSMHWNQMGAGLAKARTANLNVDFMWDMCNSICGYNPGRFFSVKPFVGLGGTFAYRYRNVDSANDYQDGHVKHNQWLLPVSAGVHVDFRCSDYVKIFAEARGSFYGDNFNNTTYGKPVDIDLAVVGGVSVALSNPKFERYNPCDYMSALSSANAQINDLRGALATTSAALAAAEAQLPCPDVPEAVVVESQATTIMPTVRFKINSAYVSSEEMVNVYNIAEYLKANPDTRIVVRGYADKATGSSSYNMKLSQRRAQAVADILIGDYGIAEDRLIIEAAGSDTQVYDTNNWNRIVIFAAPVE